MKKTNRQDTGPLDGEVFKQTSYPGYEVSNVGRVRRSAYVDSDNKYRKSFVLTQSRMHANNSAVAESRLSKGNFVYLMRGRDKYKVAVAGLVYRAFVGELDSRRYRLAFVDGDPTNANHNNLYAEPRRANSAFVLLNKLHRLRAMYE